MKVSKGSSLTPGLVILGLACILFNLQACKKSISSKSPADSVFRFTFNGTRYELPYKEGIAEWGIEQSGIFINRPDIFNGTIHFPNSNCAFLDPSGSSIQFDGNCKLTASGRPIDSATVYFYQSGLVNVVYKNCTSRSQYDPFTDQRFTYQVCDADGTFNLALKNKANQTITITDGKFEIYSLRR